VDVIGDKQHLFVGSRLRRLAQRMQGDATPLANGAPLRGPHALHGRGGAMTADPSVLRVRAVRTVRRCPAGAC
jgi:hypothetical protein